VTVLLPGDPADTRAVARSMPTGARWMTSELAGIMPRTSGALMPLRPARPTTYSASTSLSHGAAGA
jgi:hypothetical protein